MMITFRADMKVSCVVGRVRGVLGESGASAAAVCAFCRRRSAGAEKAATASLSAAVPGRFCAVQAKKRAIIAICND